MLQTWNATRQWITITYNTDKAHKYNVQQKKPDTEEYMLNDFIYIKFKKKVKTKSQHLGRHA
jgi:hypothetical protein